MNARSDLGEKPHYVVHEVHEKDVTVDWFFGDRSFIRKLPQLLLVVLGWFFSILPLVITIDALVHRDEPIGWWTYREGFEMWDLTIAILGVLLVVFVVGFLALHVLDRRGSRRQRHEVTYDAERLQKRLTIADQLYERKFGAPELRHQQRSVRIEPHSDLETYELRDQYRRYGVDA